MKISHIKGESTKPNLSVSKYVGNCDILHRLNHIHLYTQSVCLSVYRVQQFMAFNVNCLVGQFNDVITLSLWFIYIQPKNIAVSMANINK